jgi:hypothetical protein
MVKQLRQKGIIGSELGIAVIGVGRMGSQPTLHPLILRSVSWPFRISTPLAPEPLERR